MRGRTGLSAGQVTPSNMTRAKCADAKRDLCLVAIVQWTLDDGGSEREVLAACREWAKAERVAGRLP